MDHASPEGQSVELRDGRRLGLAEYGRPGGLPVFLLPGMPGSRLLGRHAAGPAAELGIRLVSLDRPGIGLSHPKPSRTIVDTAADVAELADLLGIDGFQVIGISAGGAHALACAWMLPRRVVRVALVSSVAPPTGPGQPVGKTGVPAPVRRAILRGEVDEAGRPPPGFVLREMEQAAPPADRAVLARRDIKELLALASEEAFRHGTRAVVREARLGSSPWGFLPKDIAVEVDLWHGEHDTTIPVEAARQLAEALPRCRATYVVGAGHLWHLEHLGEVLSALARGA